MSTLDVVAQAGAKAANFLDVAVEQAPIRWRPRSRSCSPTRRQGGRVHQHLRRHHPVRSRRARGARRVDHVEATVPLVVRLDGTNAEEGRAILAEAAHPRIVPAATMLEAAERAAALANGAAA